MTERRPCEVRIAAPALHDIGEIWMWTVERFGHTAALRYEMLIEQAIADLADSPDRAGARERTDLLAGVWLYHLVFSRGSVPRDHVVKSPRHFVMYRHVEVGVIEILRILHDRRDLARYLPNGVESE